MSVTEVRFDELVGEITLSDEQLALVTGGCAHQHIHEGHEHEHEHHHRHHRHHRHVFGFGFDRDDDGGDERLPSW